jgi:hypothetical protein
MEKRNGTDISPETFENWLVFALKLVQVFAIPISFKNPVNQRWENNEYQQSEDTKCALNRLAVVIKAYSQICQSNHAANCDHRVAFS